MQTYSQYFKVVYIKLFYILYLWFIYLGILELNAAQVAQTYVTRKRCKVVYIPKLTSDLCDRHVENNRLCNCMRNKILRSANAKNELKWIKKTYLWCIPLCFGLRSATTVFFFGLVFLAFLHNHHQYPRRPRGSQEKRRNESFLADWLPLGLQGCITTVPLLKGQSQRCSFWSGRVLDQSQQKRHFFCQNSIQCKVFQLQLVGGKPLLPLGEINSKMLDNFPIKSSLLYLTSRHVWLSSSNCGHCCAYHLICIWNWKPHQVRLRVVPHLSSGIVEWVRVKISPREKRRHSVGTRKFFSLPTASRLSHVGWFSRALAFRSLSYFWGKMGDYS